MSSLLIKNLNKFKDKYKEIVEWDTVMIIIHYLFKNAFLYNFL